MLYCRKRVEVVTNSKKRNLDGYFQRYLTESCLNQPEVYAAALQDSDVVIFDADGGSSYLGNRRWLHDFSTCSVGREGRRKWPEVRNIYGPRVRLAACWLSVRVMQ